MPLKNLANFLLFQAGWFACVGGAARGQMWFGPLVVFCIAGLHIGFFARAGERWHEVKLMLSALLLGLLADSGLYFLGATRYPSSAAAWPFLLPPPWIGALWLLFASLPAHSLAWLGARPKLAILLGALGGPLSYWGGVRLGVVGVAEQQFLTWGALAIEYALVTPILLKYARPWRAQGL